MLTLCIYPSCVWAVSHHVHEGEVDEIGPATDTDDTSLQLLLFLPRCLERRQNLRVLERGGRGRAIVRWRERERERDTVEVRSLHTP